MFTLEEIKEAAEKHNVINSGFAVKNDGNVSEIKNEERVNSAVFWIKQHMFMQHKFSTSSSYEIKHICEYDIGHISNGEFIVAAILAGYRYRRDDGETSKNCRFNMRESRIQYLEKRKNQRVSDGEYAPVGKEEIAKILDLHPLLNCLGYDTSRITSDNGMVSDLSTRREELINQHDVVNACALWIKKHLESSGKLNADAYSEDLGHITEREIGTMPHGVFIVAAIACGYRHRPGMEGPYYAKLNGAIFNISRKSIDLAKQRVGNLDKSQTPYPDKALFDFEKTFR